MNPIRLTQLEPEFISLSGDRGSFREVENIGDAQGISFLCPACFEANGGSIGTHSVICWSRSRGVPDHIEPAPGRWAMVGTNFHDLTLNADLPSTARSVDLTANGKFPKEWHGFITNGEVT